VPNGTKLFTVWFMLVDSYSNGREICCFVKLETSIRFLQKPHSWKPALGS